MTHYIWCMLQLVHYIFLHTAEHTLSAQYVCLVHLYPVCPHPLSPPPSLLHPSLSLF